MPASEPGPGTRWSPPFSLRPIQFELWILLAIALIGVTRIPEPFDGLQALFMMMARSLHRGATLYVDVWDVKQPGIFLFYELAGRLFGFSEIGAHLLELFYQLITAAVLIWLVRKELRQPLLAGLAGFLAVGTYYLSAIGRHLGQVEGLIGLPMLLTVALASQPAATPGQRRARMFGAGLTAGVVAVFKLILAPLPALAWLVAYAVRRSEEGPSAGRFFRDWLLPAVAGTAVVLGGTALWAQLHGGLPELLWTSFRYPILAVTESQHVPWGRLEESVLWFVSTFWIAILLALGCGMGWRGWRKEVLVLQALAWMLMGLAAILAQKLSYWSYHFELLLPPVAILAARGCDGFADQLGWLRSRPRAVAGTVMVLVVVVGCRLTLERVAAALEVAAQPSPVAAYQSQVAQTYRDWRAELTFLDGPSALPGPIYVFGTPLVIWLGHREQAGAIQGWSWELFPQPLWDRLPGQLETSRPAYVLILPGYFALLQRRSPATLSLLRKAYRPLSLPSKGTWYERIVPGRAAPAQGSHASLLRRSPYSHRNTRADRATHAAKTSASAARSPTCADHGSPFQIPSSSDTVYVSGMQRATRPSAGGSDATGTKIPESAIIG